MISIAIDGPSGAGKSSLARALAQKMEYLYIDTGALYRGVALAILRAGVDTKDAAGIEEFLPQIDIRLIHRDNQQCIFLGNEDVSEAIRENNVSMAASDVSALPAVRAFLLELQRKLARENNVIMDGRDIGTVILPEAQVKIFLTATPQDRTHRRYRELMKKGIRVDYDDLLKEMIQRDHNDTNREISPLKPASDAITVDTTGFEFEQSLNVLTTVIQERLK